LNARVLIRSTTPRSAELRKRTEIIRSTILSLNLSRGTWLAHGFRHEAPSGTARASPRQRPGFRLRRQIRERRASRVGNPESTR